MKLMRKAPKKDRLLCLLLDAGVHPTRQRMALASLLFDGTKKHITAEEIHAAARRKHFPVSLATVYNTLHEFKTAGLLREIVVGKSHSYFDNNSKAHYHIYDEATGKVRDISSRTVRLVGLPKSLKGRNIGRIDVMIRICKK